MANSNALIAVGERGIWCEKCKRPVDSFEVDLHPQMIQLNWSTWLPLSTARRTLTVRCHGEEMTIDGFIREDGGFEITSIREWKENRHE